MFHFGPYSFASVYGIAPGLQLFLRAIAPEPIFTRSSRHHGCQVARIAAGGRQVLGVMLESHLHPGAQKFTPGKDDAAALVYGQSITDACLGWDDSLQALQVLSDAVKARRSR